MATASNPAVRRPRRPTKVVGTGVLTRLKAMIARGELQPGDKLPAERDLAVRLGVSRPSLREALRTLVVMGALDTRHGSGTLLSPTGANVLKSSFEMLVLLEQPAIEDLYETRELIEVHLAGRAAERRLAGDLRILARALSDLEAATPGARACVEANLRFHTAIAAAARCVVLERVMACMHDSISDSIRSAAAGVDDLDGSLAVHRSIYQSIRRGDAEGARQAMAQHMAMARADAGRALQTAAKPRNPS